MTVGQLNTCGSLTAAEVAARRLAGQTHAQIARAAGVSTGAVQWCLKRQHLTGRRGGARAGDGWMQRQLGTIRDRQGNA